MEQSLNQVRKHLRAGQVYRRGDLTKWSKAVDRHLQRLQEEETLVKLAGGLYYCPKETAFGFAPAKETKLVSAFLKDTHFLLSSPNAYNSLGLGTTQLYNETIVYNHKRHGKVTLDGREFNFVRKANFPKTLTPEFLLVDLVNNLNMLAEDHSLVLNRVKEKAPTVDTAALAKAAYKYGKLKTKKFFNAILGVV